MEIVRQDWEFLDKVDQVAIMTKLEYAGRLSHKTEGKLDPNDYPGTERFIRKIIEMGHHSVLEHASISVHIITDRGVTHELVRHRLASYTQESTRYCDYGSSRLGIKFIEPIDFILDEADIEFLASCENHYEACRAKGLTPQQARYFLPNGLKTEIVVTMNLREWRHFFNTRAAPDAHPQMVALARSLLNEFKFYLPVIFEGIEFEQTEQQKTYDKGGELRS